MVLARTLRLSNSVGCVAEGMLGKYKREIPICGSFKTRLVGEDRKAEMKKWTVMVQCDEGNKLERWTVSANITRRFGRRWERFNVRKLVDMARNAPKVTVIEPAT